MYDPMFTKDYHNPMPRPETYKALLPSYYKILPTWDEFKTKDVSGRDDHNNEVLLTKPSGG